MNTVFFIDDIVYSLQKLNIGILINTCAALGISLQELREGLNKQNLKYIVYLIYYSIRDKKQLEIKDILKLDIETLDVLIGIYIEVNKG